MDYTLYFLNSYFSLEFLSSLEVFLVFSNVLGNFLKVVGLDSYFFLDFLSFYEVFLVVSSALGGFLKMGDLDSHSLKSLLGEIFEYGKY